MGERGCQLAGRLCQAAILGALLRGRLPAIAEAPHRWLQQRWWLWGLWWWRPAALWRRIFWRLWEAMSARGVPPLGGDFQEHARSSGLTLALCCALLGMGWLRAHLSIG